MTLQTQIREKIADAERTKASLVEILNYLGERDCVVEKATVTLCGDSLLDFDTPSRADVLNLLAILHGAEWKKSASTVSATLNYDTIAPVIGNRRLRLWAAEPPGTCKMVEERVFIPAQPERTEIRRVLRCTPDAADAVEIVNVTAGEAVAS